jgi:hypothetical protein
MSENTFAAITVVTFLLVFGIVCLAIGFHPASASQCQSACHDSGQKLVRYDRQGIFVSSCLCAPSPTSSAPATP